VGGAAGAGGLAQPSPPSPPAPSATPRPDSAGEASPSGELWPAYSAAARARIEERIEGNEYQARVQATFGAVEVRGPAAGVGGVVTRYWAAFVSGDFDSVIAFGAGEFKERLSTYASEQGRKEFAASVESRMVGNPIVNIRVEPSAAESADKATLLAITRRADGKEERREVHLVKRPEGWRIEKVRQQN
jgi:hypothetical protein